MVIDNVVPHKTDKVLMWDMSNRQPACRLRHDVVKQRLEALFADGRLPAADLWLDGVTAVALLQGFDAPRGVGSLGSHVGHELSRHHALRAISPPSTGITAPVRNEAAGRHRLKVMCATSSGSP